MGEGSRERVDVVMRGGEDRPLGKTEWRRRDLPTFTFPTSQAAPPRFQMSSLMDWVHHSRLLLTQCTLPSRTLVAERPRASRRVCTRYGISASTWWACGARRSERVMMKERVGMRRDEAKRWSFGSERRFWDRRGDERRAGSEGRRESGKSAASRTW